MRKLLLTALLCLTICACCAQDDFQLGQHVTAGNWRIWSVTKPSGIYKMAFIYSDLLYFDRGEEKSSLTINLWENNHCEVILSNDTGLFTNDPIGDSITYRIDKGPYQTTSIKHSYRGSKHSIYPVQTSDMYVGLLHAKSLSIRAVFEDGPRWMFFDVTGFNMNLLHIRNDEW